MDDRQPPNTLLSPGEEMSPTEQEVIDEYVRLADNMKKVLFPPLLFWSQSNHYSFSANPPPPLRKKKNS